MAPHVLVVPAIALEVMALVERLLGGGVSLGQAFDGVPEVAIMMAVGYAADLAFAGWKVAAWSRGRGGRLRPRTNASDRH